MPLNTIAKLLKNFILLFVLLPVQCNGLFYYPDRVVYDEPTRRGIPYERVSFLSADGTRLCGWLFPAEGKLRGAILQLHGNAENMTSHYRLLHWLTREGYTLFAFDYRGYGCSEGQAEREGILNDAVAAYRYLAALPKDKTGGRLIIYGQSLGGKIAQDMLLQLTEQEVASIGGMVLEGAFESYQQMAADALKSNILTWIFFPLACLLVSEKHSAAGKQVSHPAILVIHGTQDKVVPYKYAAILAKKYQAPLLTIEGGGHLDAAFIDGFRWRPKILAYLNGFPHRLIE